MHNIDRLEGISKNNLFHENQPNKEMFENIVKYFFDGKDFNFERIENSSAYKLSSLDNNHNLEFYFGNHGNILNTFCVNSIIVFEYGKKVKRILFFDNMISRINVYADNSIIVYENNFISNESNEFHFNLKHEYHSIVGPAIKRLYGQFRSLLDEKYFIYGKEIKIPYNFKNNPQEYLKNYEMLT